MLNAGVFVLMIASVVICFYYGIVVMGDALEQICKLDTKNVYHKTWEECDDDYLDRWHTPLVLGQLLIGVGFVLAAGVWAAYYTSRIRQLMKNEKDDIEMDSMPAVLHSSVEESL